MPSRPLLALALLCAGLTGCSTFTKPELAQVRQSGVSPAVVGKFEHSSELRPDEIIQLTKRGVSDDLIIRQIQDAGVDYVVTADDVKRLRRAHVSRPVMDALFAASDEFARDHAPGQRTRVYASFYGPGPYDYEDPYYYGAGYGVPVYGIGLGYYHSRAWGGRYWH